MIYFLECFQYLHSYYVTLLILYIDHKCGAYCITKQLYVIILDLCNFILPHIVLYLCIQNLQSNSSIIVLTRLYQSRKILY